MIRVASISTLSRALSPVVHNEVMPFGHDYPKGAAKKQRTMPINVERDGKITREMVPIISGNSIRGISRRLLVDHSLDELGINLEDLLGNKEDARRLLFFLRNGGLTPKGSTIEKAHAGVYEETQAKLPFLQVLGGVYLGHHFEGCVKIGITIPLTVETMPIFKNVLAKEHLEEIEGKPLPHIHDLFGETRYTRRAAVGDSEDDKESMIYGTEIIPAGTYFYSWASVVSPYESAIKTFKAMFWLLSEYGLVGGMTGRGHGKMLFSHIYTDNNGTRKLTNDDYQKYVNYLRENGDEIKKFLKGIPNKFRTQSKPETAHSKAKSNVSSEAV